MFGPRAKMPDQRRIMKNAASHPGGVMLDDWHADPADADSPFKAALVTSPQTYASSLNGLKSVSRSK